MVCGMEELTQWCTFAAAAEILGVSLSQVFRYAEGGQLTPWAPICGSHESARHKRVLRVSEVQTLKDARAMVKPVIRCSCHPHPVFGHEDGCRYVGSGAIRG